jgi:hypothetical protein
MSMFFLTLYGFSIIFEAHAAVPLLFPKLTCCPERPHLTSRRKDHGEKNEKHES